MADVQQTETQVAPIPPVNVGQFDFWDDVPETQELPSGGPVAAEGVGQPPPPLTPTINDDLVQRAMGLGLTPEDAHAYSSPAELTRTLNLIERNFSLMRPRAAEPDKIPPPPVIHTDPLNAFEAYAKEQGWDENYVKHHAAVVKHQNDKIAKLEEQLNKTTEPIQKIVQSEQQRAAQQFNNQFDSLLIDLPDAFADILGREPVAKAPREKIQERVKLIEQMNIIGAGYAAMGKQPQIPQIFKQAVYALYGEESSKKASERAKANAATMVRDRNGAFLQRAESRAPEPLNGRDAAVEAVRELRQTSRFQPQEDNTDWSGWPSRS